ncbi:microneme protein MIC11 [Toxoplasma gondii TgCatPRC2]|uniref:Microneme protein MIC11 n=13 Tax=Toxoplasma gondii TaxID=5811 RepID=B9PUW8_TOXGV|nr:microneme protein MIC11 [Toxoplasma gondii ME49]EPR61504.1 microneme protein MIC11 [Toxoplasma gondii GT1]ESS33132.1 microneme protein MIC11 [Toxoplasma gondii VEG]KAF4642732.1 microneme protein MIC11 [Toxoplasma gondii]KFG27610.1 microneme protein MIC11 [Toxoplasma gondii p89]KFG38132.1 microneme protein MIC11 [Toxoplasma gondii GAB2-2007-GAL-DOM2]KFG39710.1 microneme protein MIC11 [Toxoplasma gondii FOU]KFG61746.1 microneme protein MIC11 [Toxoplasma gondii RUB]KFH07346.1 microneme prot|eukprot:XP_018637299.1 microneme protein MIC11 [Toxoplasma gondii ME49]
MQLKKLSVVSITLLGLFKFVNGVSEGVVVPVRFGSETARADLLNQVSETVFSLVETTEDDKSAASIVRGAFRSALKEILVAVKGEVQQTCEELADLAARKIHEAEERGEGRLDKEEAVDDESDFSFLDSPKTSEASIRPHGFLQERKFVDTLKTLAKGALKTFVEPMKAALVDGIRPMLPKIKEVAIDVFRQACEHAEEKLQDA